MTDIKELCERLRAVESSQSDGIGVGYATTNWYRNPDGPAAADEIEHLRDRVKALEGALEPFVEFATGADRIRRQCPWIDHLIMLPSDDASKPHNFLEFEDFERAHSTRQGEGGT